MEELSACTFSYQFLRLNYLLQDMLIVETTGNQSQDLKGIHDLCFEEDKEFLRRVCWKASFKYFASQSGIWKLVACTKVPDRLFQATLHT